MNELAADIHSSQDIVQPLVNIDEVHEMEGHQHEEASQPPSPRRYPARVRQPPSRFGKYVSYSSRYPLELGLHGVSSSHSAFLSKILTETEPRNFVEANQSPKWRQAMHDELQALDENKTWSIVPLPKGQKLIGARWIYKLKYNSDGSLECYKARLVARGFTQNIWC